jgi:DNA polymerase (family 10)
LAESEDADPSEIVVAGSLRRKEKRVGDLDVLVLSSPVWESLTSIIGLDITSYGDRKAQGEWQGMNVDFRFVQPEEFGAALDYFTGPRGHNIGMRRKAKEQGYKLNEYGLFDDEDNRVAGETEQSIYTALGHPWKPPEQRGK